VDVGGREKEVDEGEEEDDGEGERSGGGEEEEGEGEAEGRDEKEKTTSWEPLRMTPLSCLFNKYKRECLVFSPSIFLFFSSSSSSLTS